MNTLTVGKIYAFPYYCDAGDDPKGPLAWFGMAVLNIDAESGEVVVQVCDEGVELTNHYYVTDAQIAVDYVEYVKDADAIRRARVNSARHSRKISKKSLIEDYNYTPKSTAVKDTYDYKNKTEDPIKNRVNSYLGEVAYNLGCKRALVLDYVNCDITNPGVLTTSKMLHRQNIYNIDVPNVAIDGETARFVTDLTEINVHAMKCSEFLREHPSKKYDMMFLDFCGQLTTNKSDIVLALDRIDTKCTLFAVTLYIWRTHDEKKEACERFIVNEFEKRGLSYESLTDGVLNGGVCTWMWILRKNVKKLIC